MNLICILQALEIAVWIKMTSLMLFQLQKRESKFLNIDTVLGVHAFVSRNRAEFD